MFTLNFLKFFTTIVFCFQLFSLKGESSMQIQPHAQSTNLVTVSSYSAEDFSPIASVFFDAFKSACSDHQILEQLIQEEQVAAQQKNNFHYFSAVIDNNIVGALTYTFLPASSELMIRLIGVCETYKRRGIDSLLINTLAQQWPGVQRIFLVTRKTNEQACGFFTKLGFNQYVFAPEKLYSSYYFDPEKYVGFEKSKNEKKL